MSIRHVRAVQKYSRIEDDAIRHILEIIALDIGRDDSPAYTSNRKIADRSRQSLRAVRDAIEACVDCGELVAHKDGKYMFYKLNADLLPYGRTRDTDEPSENIGKTADNPLVTISDLEGFEQRLLSKLIRSTREDDNNRLVTISDVIDSEQRLLSKLIQELFPLIQNTRGGDNGSKESKYGKNSPHIPPIVTPTLPGANPDDFDDELSDMETCLGQVCRETLTYPPHHEKIRSGAKALLADGHTVADVRKFFAPGETYWYVQSYGKNGQKPYVANVLNEIAAAREAGKVQQVVNNAEQAWANVLGQVSSVGHSRFRDWKITAVERAAFVAVARQNGGIADVCTVPSGVLNSHIKAAFIQAYNNEATT